MNKRDDKINDEFGKFSFCKEERLHSKKIIGQLFSEGKSFLVYPFKFIFTQLPLSGKYPARVAFSVSKRNFKKAVQRNLIKRRMREVYRLNKSVLYKQTGNLQVAIFIIFVGKEIPGFKQFQVAMKKGIARLINELFSDKQ